MVLEYCSGGEVLDHLHKIMKYTEAEAAKLFAQIVSAISYLHNLNLIHRDIKPENVLFVRPVEEYEAEGKPLRIKVIDLGMATLYNPQKEVLGCVGTPGFVAPEVWNDQPQTFAMDIYSLGVMLFIMLTGRKPHSGADIRKMDYCNKSIHNAPGLKDDRYLSLSSAARELLLAMMADDPRVRPTCMEVLRHPFITAVDSNAEAHREMGAAVRGRIRDLHRIRRLHGLRYALHASRPQGGNQQAFLEALEQRRLRLKGEPAHGRESCSENDVEGPCMLRSSLCANYEDGPSSGYDTTTATTTTTTTSATTTTMPTGTFSSSAYSNSSKLSKLFGRPSGDSGVGSHRGDKGAMGTADPVPKLDKLALMSALPEMRYCTTMPPRRFAGPLLPDLSPVPSCDQSTFGNLEEAMLPRNWSAHPVMYEALGVRDQLLEGLALGVETAFPVERAAASRDLQGEMGAGREPFSQEPVSTTVQRVPEQPPTGPPQQAAGMVVAR
ncbi:hypothetical protein Vretimale_9477 [Volvox reticuliferus]|nr:hypothetical protein Vretimale_9477 [Volvox reticuliferus]